MKVAIVDDYLRWGGAVQVVSALHELFPDAPIYTIFSEVEKDKLLKEKFKNAKITESWFAKLPSSFALISPLRFLIPLIWAGFDFSGYDLVISSASWAITKGFAKGKTREICYCHTPPRYLYGYETSRNWQKHWYIRLYAAVVNHFMRVYDFKQAQKVTLFIANSREVAGRIKKFYRRESTVINPPVDVNSNVILATKRSPESDSGCAPLTRMTKGYFLTGGRLEMPKNFDLIIQAFNKLKLPLKVYGTGFQEEYLRSIAGPNVEFAGVVGNEERTRLMAGAKAFIVAAVDEDFGITPVEAMAAGRPVIAYRGGGYLETVVDPTSPADSADSAGQGATGKFFDEPTVDSLVKVLKSFDHKKYKPEDCRKQAQKFSKERFKKEILEFIEGLE